MPKVKRKPAVKKKKSFFRAVHFQMVVVLTAYFLFSNFIFLRSVAHTNLAVSFVVPFLYGVTSTFAFLYLFSHEDFFHFMRRVENEEKTKEKKFLKKFSHFGKILACILVSAIGGSIFLALTVRFLFSDNKTRYWVAFFSTLITTFIMVALAEGVFKFIF